MIRLSCGMESNFISNLILLHRAFISADHWPRITARSWKSLQRLMHLAALFLHFAAVQLWQSLWAKVPRLYSEGVMLHFWHICYDCLKGSVRHYYIWLLNLIYTVHRHNKHSTQRHILRAITWVSGVFSKSSLKHQNEIHRRFFSMRMFWFRLKRWWFSIQLL